MHGVIMGTCLQCIFDDVCMFHVFSAFSSGSCTGILRMVVCIQESFRVRKATTSLSVTPLGVIAAMTTPETGVLLE